MAAGPYKPCSARCKSGESLPRDQLPHAHSHPRISLADGPDVPMLLITLLVAVGEDYSVLLVTRTEEERRTHSPRRGITEALVKTGGLISGAGLIMAGTFSALAFGGAMAGMQQLGFALCFGMLLDTFVVRPLMVPSFLDLPARWGRRTRAVSRSQQRNARFADER